MRHPITILFGYVFIFVGRMCVFPFLDDPPEHYDCLIALVLHALIGVLLTLFFGWPALLLTLIFSGFYFGRCRLVPFLRSAQFSRRYFQRCSGLDI
jgi:hypothetical protein